MQPFDDVGSATRAVECAYARMPALKGNPAFIHVVPREQALARAGEVERSDKPMALAGVPFAVKDNVDVAGLATTAGCPAFAYEAKRSAFAVHFSFGRRENGSCEKKRSAFSCVILFTSSSGTPTRLAERRSGECGQVVSECG